MNLILEFNKLSKQTYLSCYDNNWFVHSSFLTHRNIFSTLTQILPKMFYWWWNQYFSGIFLTFYHLRVIVVHWYHTVTYLYKNIWFCYLHNNMFNPNNIHIQYNGSFCVHFFRYRDLKIQKICSSTYKKKL